MNLSSLLRQLWGGKRVIVICVEPVLLSKMSSHDVRFRERPMACQACTTMMFDYKLLMKTTICCMIEVSFEFCIVVM